jgi:hypothetical protein
MTVALVFMSLYEHVPHPHIEARKLQGPTKVNDHRQKGSGAAARFNARFGLGITNRVGTMWTGYVFTLLAFLSLPAVLSGFHAFKTTFPNWMIRTSIIALIAWVAQTFLQLVLLPIIIVGQNVQAAAADKRAEATYQDADAVLHEALQIQDHLQAQDAAIERILDHLGVPVPPPTSSTSAEPPTT